MGGPIALGQNGGTIIRIGCTDDSCADDGCVVVRRRVDCASFGLDAPGTACELSRNVVSLHSNCGNGQ